MAFWRYGEKTEPSFPAWIGLNKSDCFSSNGVEVLKTIKIQYLLSPLTFNALQTNKF